ncbi:hypothetical protein [Mesorhizobium sp. B2-3-4]|uniref:hypothetical protein n=1 Tax=Mesorhizobium sp. B2-3-4 TaxID=2589959 RepID=UPI00112B6239|nr:hypothetical protein [Mesorhizobium sp. B2-3-4]TPM28226.1 hypothetical protein FJ967_29020 [Mesorhizobium sp. B2-3-4]
MEIGGRFGCTFTATPATIFDQFSSYAFASLMYDFVAVDSLDYCIDLHTNGYHPKEGMRRAFTLFRDKKIVFEAAELKAEGVTAEQILKAYPDPQIAMARLTEIHQAHELAKNADAKLNNIEEFIRKKIDTPSAKRMAIPSEYHEEFMEAISNMNSCSAEFDRLSTKIILEIRGYKIDSGHLVKWDHGNNNLLRPLLDEGRIPLLSQSPVKSTQRSLLGGTETYALVLQRLPFPTDLPADEFVDFRNDKKVRRSIRAFREIADKIAEGGAPLAFVLEEISDLYDEYAKQVDRLRARRVLANIKFIASNLFGFAEDIAKLRLENFAKRPFEIVDYFLDYKEKEKATENSPFFFVHEKAPQ